MLFADAVRGELALSSKDPHTTRAVQLKFMESVRPDVLTAAVRPLASAFGAVEHEAYSTAQCTVQFTHPVAASMFHSYVAETGLGDTVPSPFVVIARTQPLDYTTLRLTYHGRPVVGSAHVQAAFVMFSDAEPPAQVDADAAAGAFRIRYASHADAATALHLVQGLLYQRFGMWLSAELPK